MHSSTLDRTQTQYERKLARQKQLDLMEAAAAGQPFDTVSVNSPDAASVNSRHSRSTTTSHQAPEGAIESARRFLWDEDDVIVHHVTPATTHTMTAASAYDMYSSDGQVVGLMKTTSGHATVATGSQQPSSAFGFGSRMANTIMGTLSLGRGNRYDDDDDDDVVNIAPRRGRGVNAFVSDAHAREADEYMDSKRRTVRRTSVSGYGSGGFLVALGDCCLIVYHTCVGAFAILCEYISAWWATLTPKLCAMTICVLTGIGLFIFAIVAIVSRASGTAAPAATASDLPNIVDSARYDTIRSLILESQFTSADALDLAGTAQNYALRWITDQDPAKLREDHDALLQRYALATFYFSTYVFAEIVDSQTTSTGSAGGWTYGDYWMSDKGICMWYGITCTPHLKEGVQEVHYNENSDVLRFNLTNNNIRGVIPSELSALENLVSLDLGDNNLQGTIPKSLSNLQDIRELYLQDNLLTGTIHSELGKLRTVRDMFLGTNKLTGTIPSLLGQLTELRALGLDENLLTGIIPNIWTCTKLLILYLDDNQLTGSISPRINALTELVDLRLRTNALTGSIPVELHDLTHLELLYLDDNRLGGSIPATWDLMKRLQEIQVYKNDITGVLPDSLSTLRDLKVFYADNNKIKGTIPTSYGALGDLETFFIFNNELSGPIPTEFGNLKNLLELQVYNNKLTGPFPSELGSCYKLQKLEAHDNAMTGSIPYQLGSIESQDGDGHAHAVKTARKPSVLPLAYKAHHHWAASRPE